METQENKLRVSVHEHELHALQERFPKLTRSEVLDIIARKGPMRSEVETELARISASKR